MSRSFQCALNDLCAAVKIYRDLRRDCAHQRHMIEMKMRYEHGCVQTALFRADKGILAQVRTAVKPVDSGELPHFQQIADPVVRAQFYRLVEHGRRRIIRSAEFENHPAFPVRYRGNHSANRAQSRI